jgi:DNA-binding transcriptional ArsR family regulator
MTPRLFSDRSQAEVAAERLRVLAHPSRLLILGVLSAGERSVADIEAATALKQPGLSQQLGELRQAGLVHTRREGRSVCYRLADERVRILVAVLSAVLADDGSGVASLRDALASPVHLAAPVTVQAAAFARAGSALSHLRSRTAR